MELKQETLVVAKDTNGDGHISRAKMEMELEFKREKH